MQANGNLQLDQVISGGPGLDAPSGIAVDTVGGNVYVSSLEGTGTTGGGLASFTLVSAAPPQPNTLSINYSAMSELTLTTGVHDDTISQISLATVGNLVVDAGDGNNTVNLTDWANTTSLTTGAGTDSVSIHSSSAQPAITPVNVANNASAVATQSSTLFGHTASDALTGIANALSFTDNLANSFWQDALGATYFLSSISIVFGNSISGTTFPEANSNFHVSVLTNGTETFGQDFFVGSGGQPVGVPLTVNLPNGVYGDTIKIQFLGLNNAGTGYLSLAHVQAFSAPTPGLTVNTGAGADFVNLLNTLPGDNVAINEGTGSDTLQVSGTNISPRSSGFADGGSGSGPPADVYTDALLYDLAGNPSLPATPAIPNGSIKALSSLFGTLDYVSYEAIPGFTPATATAGDYEINEGQSATLHGSVTPAPNSTVQSVLWDLNDDGTFGDTSGQSPTVSWAQLTALGIGTAGKYPIALKVISNNNTVVSFGMLTIDYVRPTVTLNNPATGSVGVPYTIGFSASEVGSEVITGWTVMWPDNTVDTLPSDATTDTHTFTMPVTNQNIVVNVYDSHSTTTVANMAMGAATINQDSSSINPGGPYLIHAGDSLTLIATSSGAPSAFNWDISGTQTYMDATGSVPAPVDGVVTSQVTLAWSDLQKVLTTAGVINDQPQVLQNVAVQVTYPTGNVVSSLTSLEILDTPPTATFSGNDTNVGGTSTVSFANPSDVSAAETRLGFTYSFDFFDDNVFEVLNNSSPNAPVPSNIAAHPGTYTIHGRTTDNAGGFSDYTTTIAVNDVPPTVTVDPDQSVAAGTLVNLGSARFSWPGYSTPGQPETFTASVDWGDGTTTPAELTITPGGPGTPTTGTIAATHTFTPGAAYKVTVSVLDAYGKSGAATFNVTVGEPVLLVSAEPDQTIEEGGFVTLAAALFTDTAAPLAHTATVDWGDGTAPVTLPSSAIGEPGLPGESGTVAASHTYGTDGTFPVTLTVSDGMTGGTSSSTFHVTVNNVVPVVNAGPDQTVGVGNPVSINATFSDPGFMVNGAGETFGTSSATIDWGDGTSTPGVLTSTPGGPGTPTTGTVTGTHMYTTPGDHLVTVTVFDSPSTKGSGTLTVHDASPVVPLVQQAVTGVEGSPANLPPVQFSYPGTSTTFSASIDWGDGAVTQGTISLDPNSPAGTTTGTVAGTHTYGAFGAYNVRVTVSGAGGNSTTIPLQAAIANRTPTTAQLPVQFFVPNQAFTITDSFNDPGFLDTHHISIDWGDGTSTQIDANCASRARRG